MQSESQSILWRAECIGRIAKKEETRKIQLEMIFFSYVIAGQGEEKVFIDELRIGMALLNTVWARIVSFFQSLSIRFVLDDPRFSCVSACVRAWIQIPWNLCDYISHSSEIKINSNLVFFSFFI